MSDTPVIICAARAAADARDGDCACASRWVKPGGAPERWAPGVPYAAAPGLYQLPLGPEYTLIFDRLAEGSLAVLNQAALTLLNAPEACRAPSPPDLAALQHLVQLGFLQPPHPTPQALAHSATLVAWLHLAACNLACRYCYVTPGGEAMSPETGTAAIEALVRTAQARHFQNLQLKYAGGEPTLNFDTALALHDRAAELTRREGLGLQAVMLTNGLQLTDARVARLVQREIAVMVSLDGVGAVHDQQRPLPGGGSTFHAVAQTIERLITAGWPPHISITLTRHNLAALPETLAWVLDRGLHFHLNFYRGTGTLAADALRPSALELTTGLRQAYAFIEARLPAYSLLNSLLDRVQLDARHDAACGAGQNYVVIGPRGDVAQCHMHPERTVTHIRCADLLDSAPADAATERARPSQPPAACAPCPWRHWCAGGCPWENQRYCSVYKQLVPEVLRLEGLRQLQLAAT